MKKTISINISGILFHIEEDGYDKLRKYLDSINKHFSAYDEYQEIIADIENRIAEIFLGNLKNNKQVITAENVENLIQKMGTIADFKAIEKEMEAEMNGEEKKEESDPYVHIAPAGSNAGYKKLSRLERRKILGGVCAGIAHYFTIDPLWVRLIAILLLFSGNLKFGQFFWDFMPWNTNFSLSLGLWAVVAYIILWIILPVSFEEPEDKNIKKLYRNPDDRTLGGVASGLAAYFGIEVIWMRLLFIGLLFAGGSGLVIYVILWIITPVAKSITERIQMKGEAITLDNIETTIKQNMNPLPPKEESGLRKVVLAPFRFLGKVINSLGEALGPLGAVLLAVIRVFFGLIIFLVGISIALSALALLGVYFGWIPEGDLYIGMRENIPVEWINEILPVWLAIAISVVVLIPGVIITLLGISVLVQKSIIEARFGLIALGLWLLSLGICAFQIPRVVSMFKTSASHTIEEVINISEGTMVLKAEQNRESNLLNEDVRLVLTGTDATSITLLKNFEARGKNREDALNFAKDMNYPVTTTDSILTLRSYIDLKQQGKFRAQKVSLELEIPYDRPFVMEKSLLPMLRNTLYRHGYRSRDVNSRNHWVFNEKGLHCLNCSNRQPLSEADSLSRAKFSDYYFMK